MSTFSIEQACANPKMKVYRRAYVKRRDVVTGQFESNWLEISEDIKKWGSIRVSADSDRPGKLTMDGIRLVMHNDSGLYNPNDDSNSLWNGYMSQQRTLLKIEAGLWYSTQTSDGIWRNSYYPGYGYWDQEQWDQGYWDQSGANVIYTGIISGEITLSDKNEITFPVKPLTQIFKDYPAKFISGFTSTGLTASQFVTLLRDQTDGSGNFIFRPFFGDTTTNWDISATSNTLSDLNTTTAADVRDKNCWDIIEKLAEAENFTAYVDQTGVFHFTPRSAAAAVSWEFHGLGSFDSTYGHQIKSIDRYGPDYSHYYSRVQVRYREDNTVTSYVFREGASFQVTGGNAAWELGVKTFEMSNYWIPNSTTAATIAESIYTEVSSVKNVIEFKTTFVPHLTILDRCSISYDSTTRPQPENLWDLNDWDTELTWDASRGDAIVLTDAEFKFLSIEMNLDSLETKFIAREI